MNNILALIRKEKCHIFASMMCENTICKKSVQFGEKNGVQKQKYEYYFVIYFLFVLEYFLQIRACLILRCQTFLQGL